MHLLALSGHHELDQGMHGLLCVNCLYQGHVEGSERVQEKPSCALTWGYICLGGGHLSK